MKNEHAHLWSLAPDVVFLNHGSFGACPRHVLEIQNDWRTRMERQPVKFLVRELEPELDAARASLARFVGASPDDLAFVPNATQGVNTVLRSLIFQPGEELIVTDHAYNACRNALDFIAARMGVRVVVVRVPFPVQSAEEIIAPVLEAVTAKSRLALLDHVTSPTGIIFPIKRLVDELNRRGVDTLVDGAHAPGMVPLNLEQLGAAYFTGNCHKWLCAPKGAAFLHVRRDKQEAVRPLVISHGATTKRTDRSRFLVEFAWPGTHDPSPYLSVPAAIDYMGSLLTGGWPAIMAANRALALAARNVLCERLQIAEPCPEEFIGALAAVPISDAPPDALPRLPANEYPLQDALREKYGIEVPIMPWPAPPKRLVRISAQLYNSLPQYETLAESLAIELNNSAAGK